MIKTSGRRQISRKELLISFQIALVALLAYWIGLRFTALFPGYFPKIGGLWSAISAVIVVQVSKKDTADSAWLRIIGTALGAAISALYLFLFPFHAVGMGVSIFFSSLICTSLNMNSWMRLSAITVLVVMVTASLNPALNPALNALLRFCESFIGSAVAVFLISLWPKALAD
ncbi:aromatic acid exporter family protein [Synechococcus sp. GEYO]|uniref:FUSC family protein n=1 Tax=Synechococcus sp. GEYO TaxID=2575511 RepID=UPI000E0E5685|nr:FUSC family protein [Synechococcus sp. GEYO]